MRIIVPSPNSNSCSSVSSLDESFKSASEYNNSTSHNILDLNMSNLSQTLDIDMEGASVNPFSGLSAEDIQDLVKLLAEKRSKRQEPPIAAVPNIQNPPVTLPKWNGRQEDFAFYMDRLRIRVERELAPYREESAICIDIIDTLPEDKKSRVAGWFSNSKRKNVFDWQDLLDVFQQEFEDIQAQQTAHEMVLRMEQGHCQYFHEFVKDFEYKVSLSGGEELFTASAKTRQLKASLNTRLRRALIGVKLPQIKDYSKWVQAVREVAIELESFADYRPRGATQTGTKIGPLKLGAQPFHQAIPKRKEMATGIPR